MDATARCLGLTYLSQRFGSRATASWFRQDSRIIYLLWLSARVLRSIPGQKTTFTPKDSHFKQVSY